MDCMASYPARPSRSPHSVSEGLGMRLPIIHGPHPEQLELTLGPAILSFVERLIIALGGYNVY